MRLEALCTEWKESGEMENWESFSGAALSVETASCSARFRCRFQGAAAATVVAADTTDSYVLLFEKRASGDDGSASSREWRMP